MHFLEYQIIKTFIDLIIGIANTSQGQNMEILVCGYDWDENFHNAVHIGENTNFSGSLCSPGGVSGPTASLSQPNCQRQGWNLFKPLSIKNWYFFLVSQCVQNFPGVPDAKSSIGGGSNSLWNWRRCHLHLSNVFWTVKVIHQCETKWADIATSSTVLWAVIFTPVMLLEESSETFLVSFKNWLLTPNHPNQHDSECSWALPDPIWNLMKRNIHSLLL